MLTPKSNLKEKISAAMDKMKQKKMNKKSAMDMYKSSKNPSKGNNKLKYPMGNDYTK